MLLGALATRASADSALRIVPAMILPLGRSLAAGPDLPAHLTTKGVMIVYVVPGMILFG